MSWIVESAFQDPEYVLFKVIHHFRFIIIHLCEALLIIKDDVAYITSGGSIC